MFNINYSKNNNNNEQGNLIVLLADWIQQKKSYHLWKFEKKKIATKKNLRPKKNPCEKPIFKLHGYEVAKATNTRTMAAEFPFK